MDDESQYSTDEDDPFGDMDRQHEQDCEQEEHVIEQERQQERQRRRLEFEGIRDIAIGRFQQNTGRLRELNIFCYLRMKQALDFVAQEGNGGLVVFARDKPSPDNEALKLKYKKEYLVGSLIRFFRYGLVAGGGAVALDEVVRSGVSSPLHFDIEIKKVTQADLDGCDVDAVLRAQVVGFGLDGGGATNSIEDVVGWYRDIAVSPLTEEECNAGFGIIRRHILQMVTLIIPDYPDRDWCEDMMVLTGCRDSKFSLHVVMKWIFCDSAVLAMPLVAFEIARAFVIENTREVLRVESGSPEWRFRVRALMLESLAELDEGVIFFKGVNDSPFDEAIYSANHLLRAPGACKSAQGVGGLAPVLNDSSRMLVEE